MLAGRKQGEKAFKKRWEGAKSKKNQGSKRACKKRKYERKTQDSKRALGEKASKVLQGKEARKSEKEKVEGEERKANGPDNVEGNDGQDKENGQN